MVTKHGFTIVVPWLYHGLSMSFSAGWIPNGTNHQTAYSLQKEKRFSQAGQSCVCQQEDFCQYIFTDKWYNTDVICHNDHSSVIHDHDWQSRNRLLSRERICAGLHFHKACIFHSLYLHQNKKFKRNFKNTVLGLFTFNKHQQTCNNLSLKDITLWWTIVELCHEIITVTAIHVVWPCSTVNFS